MNIFATVLGWFTGPLTAIGERYIEIKGNVQLKSIERAAKADFITGEIQKAILEDDGKRAELAAAVLRRDRGDGRTAWIRPVTAGVALLFWLALTLSQIKWVGYDEMDTLLPVVWYIPPGALGTMFTAFPMGVLASFYISRPFEKFFNGRV